MTFYFSSFFIHVIQAVPHTKYRRAKSNNTHLDSLIIAFHVQ